jgi:hypothetical protein
VQTKIGINRCNETNMMHFLFNLLRIKGLYIFQTLLAYPQEALCKQHFVYCVRVMSVGCCQGWSSRWTDSIVIHLFRGLKSTTAQQSPPDLGARNMGLEQCELDSSIAPSFKSLSICPSDISFWAVTIDTVVIALGCSPITDSHI